MLRSSGGVRVFEVERPVAGADVGDTDFPRAIACFPLAPPSADFIHMLIAERHGFGEAVFAHAFRERERVKPHVFGRRAFGKEKQVYS